MRARAVLFDFGGTLYDYASLQPGDRECLLALARWAGITADEAEIRRAYRAALRRVFYAYLPRRYYLHRDLFRDAAAGMVEAFGVAPNGVQPVREAVRIEQEKEIRRRPLSILRARKGANFKPVAIGGGKAGATAVEQVVVELDETAYTLGIDPATGRILSLSYQRRGPEGTVGQLVQEFSDFRAVDGSTLPFKITASFNGQPWKEQSSTIEAITINGKVDQALFERPQTNKPH